MAQPMAYTDSAVQLQTVKTVADSQDRWAKTDFCLPFSHSGSTKTNFNAQF